ncbi:MAG: ABC transporter permease [Acidobacteria bacterium]|nr:ABC transporter permease [Acidobacteriota bacterium]
MKHLGPGFRRVNFVADGMQDLRHGMRMLMTSPGFAAIAVLMLAIGVGANTAMFSVVDSVLLRPLPFPHSEQLVSISQAKPANGIQDAFTSFDNFLEIRAQNHVFSELAGITTHDLTLTGHGEPAEVAIAGVTPELFTLLNVKPLAGRGFLAEEGNLGAAPVVVLSEEAWRQRFAADPGIIGSAIDLDRRPYTVVGVMPDSPGILFSPRQIQFWIPVAQDPLFRTFIPLQGARFLGIVARMKPGVPLTEAEAEMKTVAARLVGKFPAENSGWLIHIRPLQRVLVGNLRNPLLVLLGAVGLVLLIACANVSNLLLARAASRSREIAIRAALGASRTHILRQLLAESTALGLVGGATGVMLAFWGIRALGFLLPASIRQIYGASIDLPVLSFALALSLLASLLFGVAPAGFAARSDVQATLREGASQMSEPGARRLARNFLAAAEVALALVLLVGAGLLVRSFAALTSVHPGFDVTHLVKADIQLPRFQYAMPQQWSAFGDRFLRGLQSEPGMAESAIGLPLPLNRQGFAVLPFEIKDRPPLPKGTSETAHYVSISPGYFHVMGIPVVRGRAFTNSDNSSAPRVTIISEAFAHRFFPNQDPLGKQLDFSFPPNTAVPRQIVGIVGDIRDASMAQLPAPMMYVPFDQAPLWGVEAVVRSTLAPDVVAAAIRRQVNEIDRNLPLNDEVAVAELVNASIQQPRVRAWLLGSFAVMALVLAIAGIFGVISYSVSRRTREMGIRVALGASPAGVVRLILKESARLVFAGLAAGIALTLVLGRFLASLLFGVRATDPATYTTVALMLFILALLAAYIPARRATWVDPITALRHE